MKNYLLLFSLFLIGCNTELTTNLSIDKETKSIEYLDKNCVIEFNKIFNQMTFGEEVFQFDSAFTSKSEVAPIFYTEKDLEHLYFYTFFKQESQLSIAIADYNDNLNYHQMYFCSTHKDELYIDEGSYVICNVSFMNNCGNSISQRSRQDSILFTASLRISKLEEIWTVDSCDGNSKFNQIEITENQLNIDDSLNFEYDLYENDFQMKDTSFLNLTKIALSTNKLILEDINQPKTYYYLKKY